MGEAKLKISEIDPDPNDAALEAVEDLRKLVADKTITEFALAGVNGRGEVTTLISPMAMPFAVIGGLSALQMKLGVKYVESVRMEFSEE